MEESFLSKALVALLVPIQRRELCVAKVKGEGDMLLFDMTVFNLWLHKEHFYNGVSNTGNDYMGLNTGFDLTLLFH